MTQLSWLHVSDLQMGIRGSQWLRPDFREEFERDIRRMHERTGPWDLVLISGDVVMTGSEREFSFLTQTLESFWEYLRSLGSNPSLLAVPGNHDLVKSLRPWSHRFSEALAIEMEKDVFWSHAASELRQAVRRAFGPFSDWMNRLRPAHEVGRGQVTPPEMGILPGDFAATVVKGGARIGIVGLNSCLLDLLGAEAAAVLDMDVRQIAAVTGGDPDRWARDRDVSLLLTHHPPSMLHPEARARFVEHVAPRGRFALHVCGSLHGPPSWSLDGHPPVFQAPSLFGGDTGREYSRYGYAVGRLKFEGARRELALFPRIMRSTPPDRGALVADDAFPLGDDEAISVPIAVAPTPFDMALSAPIAVDNEAALERFVARAAAPAAPAVAPPPLGPPAMELVGAKMQAGELPAGIKLRATVPSGEALISAGTWSPSGDVLAIGLSDGQLICWDVALDRPRWLMQSHVTGIAEICFSPDGRWLALLTEDDVRFCNSTDGAQIIIEENSGRPRCFDWSSSDLLASGFEDGTVTFWSMAPRKVLNQTMRSLSMARGVSALAWSTDGCWLACGGEGRGPLEIWDVQVSEGVEVRSRQRLVGHTSDILAIAWQPRSTRLASASRDRTLRVWDVSPDAPRSSIALLEGHTDAVISVSFSHDGRLLASKSLDGTVKLFRTDTWLQVAQISESITRGWYVGLAFSSTEPILVTIGKRSRSVRLWDIDVDALLQAPAPCETTATIHEISAKVVLVGEGRAGKSCLALRLAEDRYEELGSTHGMRFWSLPAERLDSSARAPAGERREVILWDMGGQSEYRLVHQLFLRDTTVALMVVEPGRGKPALDEFEGWNQRFSAQAGDASPIRKLLVGTKVDDDVAPVDKAAIEHLVQRCQLVSYVSTSARTSRGIPELKAALAQAIDWASFGTTSRPELFQRIRRHILRLRGAKRIVLTFSELEGELRAEEGGALDGDAVRAVVAQLAKQGLVADTRLADGTRALILEVEQVERYASSLILLAKDNPHGVPAIEAGAVMASAHFPRIRDEDRLPRHQELFVVDCVIGLLLDHGICLRHEGLLIFPSLFQPAHEDPTASFAHAVSLYYDFSGATDFIYASLIAAIAMSRRFGAMRLWEDRAEFGRPGRDVSGVRKAHRAGQEARGLAHLDVYFDPETPEATRELFVSFIEDHLRQAGVVMVEQLAITCVCGVEFPDEVVRRRLAAGQADIGCSACDRRTPIMLGAQEARERDPSLIERVRALRTDVQNERVQSVTEAKTSLTEAGRTDPTSAPIRVLHLSDLHVGAGADAMSLLQPLAADLRDRTEGLGVERLDYLVVSGDITNRADPQEFERARALTSELIREFGLTAERCVIVPGNHDLDWETEVYTWKKKRHVDVKRLAPGTYREEGEGYSVRDDARYPERFRNFSQHFYHPLMLKEYPLATDQQHVASLWPDTRVQFLAMNSAWEIDEYFGDRSGIHDGALSRGLAAADQQIAAARASGQLAAGASVLRLAVWHHPITGNEKIQSDAFLTRLQQAGVRVCLHGHVHEDRADLVGYLHPTRKIHAVGAGSFGAPTHDRPESVPRLYNLMELDRDHGRLRVHTRCLRKQSGAWEGWAVWPGQGPGERRTYYDVTLR